MTAYLRSGKGHVVAVPTFIDQCRNCQGVLRVSFGPEKGSRTAFVLGLVCDGGCGVNEAVRVEPKVAARGGT